MTGNQGVPPSPFFDPLQVAIETAHKRGVELHAWFNPYRAERSVGNYSLDAGHIVKKNPDWALQINTFKFLNPGLPEVRSYVKNIIADVVSRYDIDGVHFDDYFYPYEGITNQDNQTYLDYNDGGFTNIGDWRRDNVNRFIHSVYDTIKVLKPYVKFGVSPFGIWKSGIPAGISGLNAYSAIYCDAINWLQNQKVDYLTPQLYWPFGGGQDYGKLMPWWYSQINGRHLYPGQGLYRAANWPNGEILRQIRLNRSTLESPGSVFFRALNIAENPKNTLDSLNQVYYKYKSIPPAMPWLDDVAPNSINDLAYSRKDNNGRAIFNWEIADTMETNRFVVYKFDSPAIAQNDLEDASKIIDISGISGSAPQESIDSRGTFYFTATALDRVNNESSIGNIVEVTYPEKPELAFPLADAVDQPDTINFNWMYPEASSAYSIELSLQSDFSEIDSVVGNILDTTVSLTGLKGQQEYFWRIKAYNVAGYSDYSDSWKFTTGFPVAPGLIYPTDRTVDIPYENLTFSWYKSLASESFNLEVAKSADFKESSVVIDLNEITDSSYTFTLEPNRFYFWRVSAVNQFGNSGWSVPFAFKTSAVSSVEDLALPTEFELAQNYPNPFNPETTINYGIPTDGFVDLSVYDVLGQKITTLVNDYKNAGRHTVLFNGANLPSGIYIYVLNSNGNRVINKMLLMK